MIRYYITALSDAWEMLLEFPVPKFLKQAVHSDEELLPSSTLICFPVLGFLVGLAVYVVYRLAFLAIGNPAATVLSTLFAIIFLESTSYGKNLTTIVNLLGKLMGAQSPSQDELPTSKLFSFISIYLLRISCAGFIFFYDNPFWFIVTLTLSYTVQGHMAVKKDDEAEAIFELEDDNKAWHIWAVAAVLLVMFCFLSKYCFIFILCATLLAYFFADKSHLFCQKVLGGISGKLIGVSGYTFETLCLLLGVIFLARS